MKSFTFIPIGQIQTPFCDSVETPAQGRLFPLTKGEVVLETQYEEGLKDLIGFSHIILFYIFDRSPSFSIEKNLAPIPLLDDKPRGLWATCYPIRPNPIGMTVVKIESIEKNRIIVSGIDMLDGTPIIDIKPYVRAFDVVEESRSGWFSERGLD